MKVLVVKRDKIGDLLLTTPMLAHLKARSPQAEVHLLANDYNAWVVTGNPHVDRLWVLRRARHAGRVRPTAVLQNLRMAWLLRRERFDWALVANGEHSPRALKWARLAGAANVVAYSPGVSHALVAERQMHEADRLLRLLAPLGVAPPAAPPSPRYELPDASRRFAERWLAQRGIAGYVVLGLGARRAKKQPGPEQVLRWSAHWKAKFSLDTVFMWTPGRADDPLYPGDDAIAQPVLDARAPHLHPFRGPIDEALGLIWGASASVFPDSGLMHFAAASPGGVLGLFAETDVSPSPAQWAPLGPRARWLDAPRSVAELPDSAILDGVEDLLQRDRLHAARP